MMSEYTQLVELILKNEILLEEFKDILVRDPSILNLITPEWEQRLLNNRKYQDFLKNGKNMFHKPTSGDKFHNYQSLKQPDFQVLIAARCRFGKRYIQKQMPSILIDDSPPLIKISHAMLNDLVPDITVFDYFKFNLNQCSRDGCTSCFKSVKGFEELGMHVKDVPQPCIRDTRVFDGEVVVNRFLAQMESTFQREFLAILLLKPHARYGYTNLETRIENYRIAGNVIEIIAFFESRLDKQHKPVFLGTLDKPITCKRKCEFDSKPEKCVKFEDECSLENFELQPQSTSAGTIEGTPETVDNRKYLDNEINYVIDNEYSDEL